MAGFLQMLPGLLSSVGSNEGFLGGLKDAAANIFDDLGSDKVNSGKDFGQSLARGVATVLKGGNPKTPTVDHMRAVAHDIEDDEDREIARNAVDTFSGALAGHGLNRHQNAADDQMVRIMPQNAADMSLAMPSRQSGSSVTVQKIVEPETARMGPVQSESRVFRTSTRAGREKRKKAKGKSSKRR